MRGILAWKQMKKNEKNTEKNLKVTLHRSRSIVSRHAAASPPG
jgi:hypothetical protein